MTSNSVLYWKRLWRWTTSNNLSPEEVGAVLDTKEVTEALCQGIKSYKPNKPEAFSLLQSKYPDQVKLLSVVQTLQHYIDVDTFQIWDITKHYLCNISYGTPANALKNVAFVDTRPTFLLPNIWEFYYSERIFMLKLLQYIIEFKDDTSHKYSDNFCKIYNSIKKGLMESLIEQFEKVMSTVPPPRKIQSDFGNETIRQQWAEFNLKEQVAILQNILLLIDVESITEVHFQRLFKAFRRHNFGKNQGYHELLEERHRDLCLRVMYMEVCLFMVVTYKKHFENPSAWIESTEKYVDPELTQLQPSAEHSAMLLSWMLLTLESKNHAKLFENKYQHYGSTALKMHVFEFLSNLIDCSVFSDQSKCASIARKTVFSILNLICDRFDGDGSLSVQSGVMQLCAELLQSPDIAAEFWKLHQKEDKYGVVSLWNTALEYFPYNFNMLSTLAGGLAQADKCSVRNLIGELKNLPVYTEIYNPNTVPLVSFDSDDALIGCEYFPLGNPSYRIEPGSRVTVMERKEGTMIHFRTPYSYWTIFNNEIENAMDRKKHHNMNLALQRVYEGAKVLEGVLKALVIEKEVPTSLVAPSEGVFEVLVRVQRAAAAPTLAACLSVCASLVPAFSKQIHPRLINTGLLPRVLNLRLTGAEYASGASFDSAAVGTHLVTTEQPSGHYSFLDAYIQMLCAFHEAPADERISMEILLPGLVLILREVLPNVGGWRFTKPRARHVLLGRCLRFLALILEQRETNTAANLLKTTCVYSLLHTENALELLKIVSLGNDELESNILHETNWISGPAAEYLSNLQRCLAIVMFALRLKPIVDKSGHITPLEHLIFTQNKQKDPLKVVPKVTSYINHAFNRSLPVLSCRLLKRFADSFQMSLFASLDMTAYQVRVMFLDRLRDEHESMELKVAILEFVATCVAKQPGLTEAFFMMNHEKAKAEENDNQESGLTVQKKVGPDDSFEGILGYMADYLGTVKSDAKLLHSPLLGCIMALFHELWRNNMQILVKKLRENPKFWEHMTSPLFNEIQPGLRTYGQIFNVLGIELFTSREKLEPNLKDMLELFFNTHKKYLDSWIDYIFSFDGRQDSEEVVDKVPAWLGLLTSWKDFTTIFCKCLPFSLNIAHKSKMVAPCMTSLLNELEDLKDGRLVVILAELYVIMLANWKDDCFENRKLNAKQIDSLLSATAKVYDCLHPRAVRAILSICTVAISSLDYEIKANTATAQSIIRSVTNINGMELEQLLDNMKDLDKTDIQPNGHKGNEEIPPVVLSLAMLEQCLELYDDMFSGLSQWFQSSKFINKLLCCLQACLHSRRHYYTSLAALRCITAYSRGPFSKDLLMSDVDQFLWMQLLPPKFEVNGGPLAWKPQEWWRVYAYSLDFISMMVMKHGQFFVSDAITFIGVHLEYLIEAILLPRQLATLEAMDLCASALNLIVQLVNYESRWRMENINSMTAIMRSVSVCLCQCVTLLLRVRRVVDGSVQQSDDSSPAPPAVHRTLEVLHMSTLCLLACSPSLLPLLADSTLDLERWQPLVELSFGAPKIAHEPQPQLTFGTLLAAICLLTRSLNHAYHVEEGGGSRSPRGKRRTCGCGPGAGGSGAGGGAASPGDQRRATRSSSLTSGSSATSALPALDERLVGGALEAGAALLAAQALLAVRDPNVPTRHKQLVRRELSSELGVFHDFVRKRILCAAHARPLLVRNKLGSWPLPPDEEEVKRVEEARREKNICDNESERLPPPPPKRPAHDSMREYILRKHYLDKCAQTPSKGPPSPVSHSTPTSDKKKETSRSSKRVSWAETTSDSDESLNSSLVEIEPLYSNLTDVQINNDEDFFHFMSVVFLYICQTDL